MRNKDGRFFRCFAVLTLTAVFTITSPVQLVSASTISKTSSITTYTPSTATEAAHTCVIKLVEYNSQKTLKTYYANTNDSYGPDGTIAIRDTYYDSASGKDYDLCDAEGKNLTADQASSIIHGTIKDEKELTFYYKAHSATNVERSITLQAVTEDGTVLKEAGITIDQDTTVDPSEKLGKSFQSNGNTYEAPSKSFVVTYSGDDIQKVIYKATKSESQYYVTVNYVDDKGNLITKRTFYVNNKDYYFTAPKVFSVEENGEKATYIYNKKKNGQSYTIHQKPESKMREYTLYYNKEENQSEPITFSVLQYDSYSNECIGVISKEVKKGHSITFNPADNLPKGTDDYSYKVNSSFNKKVTYKYGNPNRTVYIYYDRHDPKDPDKYSTKTKSRDITIRYQAVDETVEGHEIFPDQGQAKTKFTVWSDKEMSYSLPQEITAGGETYVLIQGQTNPVELSYYSPRETYSFYYKNKKDVNFYTIRTETTEEVEVLDNNVTWTILPGITRVIITNQTTGVTNTLATTNLNGQQIRGNAGGQNANPGNGGANANGQANNAADQNGVNNQDNADSDQSIDSIDSNEIQTPRGNIKLDQKETKGLRFQLVFAVLAAAVVLAALVFYFLKKRRKAVKMVSDHKNGEENNNEK